METFGEINNFTQNVSLSEGNQPSYNHTGISPISRYYIAVVLSVTPFGALANIFTFYVLTKHRPQTSNTCILRVLSIVDTLVLCMFFTHAFVEKYRDPIGSDFLFLHQLYQFLSHTFYRTALAMSSSFYPLIVSFSSAMRCMHANGVPYGK